MSFQPQGALVPISLPLTFVARTRVYVYTSASGIVRVPIDQAFALQGTPNTVVLGSNIPEANTDYAYAPYPYDAS